MDDGAALFPAFSHMPKDYNTMTALFQYLGENADSLKAHLLIISQPRKKREHMVSLENTIENTSTLSVSCLNNKLFDLTVNFSGTLIVCFHLSALLATLSLSLSLFSQLHEHLNSILLSVTNLTLLAMDDLDNVEIISVFASTVD